jgi:Probable Zinc-ribbon domain
LVSSTPTCRSRAPPLSRSPSSCAEAPSSWSGAWPSGAPSLGRLDPRRRDADIRGGNAADEARPMVIYHGLPMELLKRHPALLAEWHDIENGDLRVEAVRGTMKVWWRCARDPAHVWRAEVRSRIVGRGCPFCTSRRVSSTNSLAAVAPHLAAEWHPTRNGTLTAHDVTSASNKKVWWRCGKVPSHEWCTTVTLRKQGRGCPFCSGRKVAPETSLAARAPAIAAEWHPSKNGGLRPEHVTQGVDAPVWWRCPRNPEHEWQERVPKRVAQGHGCPFCSGHRVTRERSLAMRSPEMAAQWHPTKNGALTPWDINARSDAIVWWKCPAGPEHEWTTTPSMRSKQRHCPFCINKRISTTNSLAVTRPDLAAEWHPTRNGARTPAQVTAGSGHRVWWKCPRGPDHEWESPLYSRRSSSGCPFCAGKRVSVTNSLATLFPSLAQQWHPTRNAELTPAQVTAGTNLQVWWRCPFGHEWKKSPCYRTKTTASCPLCPSRKHSQALTRKRPREIVRLPSDSQ